MGWTLLRSSGFTHRAIHNPYICNLLWFFKAISFVFFFYFIRITSAVIISTKPLHISLYHFVSRRYTVMIAYGHVDNIQILWKTNINLNNIKHFNTFHRSNTNWNVVLAYDISCSLLAGSPSLWSNFESLQWRHNRHDGVSNHQPHHCLLNRLFKRRSKKTSKLNGLCEGRSIPRTKGQ